MKIIATQIGLVALMASVMPSRGAELADSLVAVVSDVPITQQGVDRFTDQEERLIIQQFRDQPEQARSRILATREAALQTLITRQIILHDFKENIKVPESIIEEIVQDRIKDEFHGDNVELTKELEIEGITREQFKQRIRDQFIIESMRARFVPEPIISPRKIEAYYTAHRSDYKIEDQIKMRMIVLNKNSGDPEAQIRTRAQEILSQVNSGASFEDLAKTYSEGSQRSEGGETGWEDFSVVNKALAEELTKLKPGQHSGVIDAADGFYILLLEDRRPTHYKAINDVRDEIEKILSSQETARLSRQWVERLKRKTFIQHF